MLSRTTEIEKQVNTLVYETKVMDIKDYTHTKLVFAISGTLASTD